MTQVVKIFKVWVLMSKMVFIKKNGISGAEIQGLAKLK